MELIINFGVEKDKKTLYKVLQTRKPIMYHIEIKEHRPKRSNSQNRYYWGVMLKILSTEFGCNQEEMHEYMKRLHNPKPVVTKHSEEILIGGSTSEMNTKEFMEYLEKIRIWALTEYDCLIPEPGDYISIND